MSNQLEEATVEELRHYYQRFMEMQRRMRNFRSWVKETRKLRDHLSKVYQVWDRLPPDAKWYLALTAYQNGAGYFAQGLDEIDGIFEPTDQIAEQIDRALIELFVASEICAEDRTGLRGRPPQIALRRLISRLMSIWETQFGKAVTFSHDGSEFEWFAVDIVKEIDTTVTQNQVHVLIGELQKEKRVRSDR